METYKSYFVWNVFHNFLTENGAEKSFFRAYHISQDVNRITCDMVYDIENGDPMDYFTDGLRLSVTSQEDYWTSLSNKWQRYYISLSDRFDIANDVFEEVVKNYHNITHGSQIHLQYTPSIDGLIAIQKPYTINFECEVSERNSCGEYHLHFDIKDLSIWYHEEDKWDSILDSDLEDWLIGELSWYYRS